MRRRAVTEVPAGARGTGSGRQPLRGLRSRSKTIHQPASARERLLKSMLQTVGETGYEAATMGLVLGRAEMSTRAFELEFASKEDCFLAAFDFGVEGIESLIRHEMRGEDTWLDRLRASLRVMLEFVDANPDIARSVMVEVLRASPEGRMRATRVMERAADCIDLALLEPDASQSDPPPKIAPEAIVAGLYGALYSRLSSGASSGFSELFPDLMYQAVLPYFGSDLAQMEMAKARERASH